MQILVFHRISLWHDETKKVVLAFQPCICVGKPPLFFFLLYARGGKFTRSALWHFYVGLGTAHDRGPISAWCSNLSSHFMPFFSSCQATSMMWNKAGNLKQSGGSHFKRGNCNLMEVFTQMKSCKVMWTFGYMGFFIATLARTGFTYIRSGHLAVVLHNHC